MVGLAKTCKFFEQTTMFRRLGQLFGKKLHNVSDFAKKHEKSSISPKFDTFSRKLPCFVVCLSFSAKKMQKVSHFANKHEKSSIWPKLATFSSRLSCFSVWVNVSGKRCNKCLISRKSMKNHRFGKSTLFRGNYHVSSFS